jgi:amino acid transporter
VIFSFSRDRAFPAYRVLGRLSTGERLPINAVALAGAVSALLLVLTGSDFYATLIAFTAGGFFVAFIFPVAATLVARLRGSWRRGAFNLGGAGLLLNAIALVWLVFMFFNIAWPRATDLPWYQNWGVFIMVGVVGALGVLAYLPVRRTITQPRALEALSKPPGAR